MKDNSKKVALVLVVITVLVVGISYIISVRNKKEPEGRNIQIVTNYSNFYTVNSCLYRVITYVASGNTEDLIKVVSDEFKKKNNLNSENVLNSFPQVFEASTFVSNKMYYESLNDSIDKYYVYGKIEEQDFEGRLSSKDAYFIVYLDYENKIFSVEPYSGDIFVGGDLDD